MNLPGGAHAKSDFYAISCGSYQHWLEEAYPEEDKENTELMMSTFDIFCTHSGALLLIPDDMTDPRNPFPIIPIRGLDLNAKGIKWTNRRYLSDRGMRFHCQQIKHMTNQQFKEYTMGFCY